MQDSNKQPTLGDALGNVQRKQVEGVTLKVGKDEAIYYSLAWFLWLSLLTHKIKEDKIGTRLYRGTLDS